MKNLIIFLVLGVCLSACGGNGSSNKSPDEDASKTAVRVNNPGFNEGFDSLLVSYLKVRDALVNWDTTAADKAATSLAIYADSLNVKSFPNDSSGSIHESANNFAGTITGSALALVGETGIQAKRKEFQMISDALYDLARSVRYDGQKLYRMRCPMAFNDTEEAYWISEVSKVRNPYIGNKHPKYKNKMVECGEVTDSLGMARK